MNSAPTDNGKFCLGDLNIYIYIDPILAEIRRIFDLFDTEKCGKVSVLQLPTLVRAFDQVNYQSNAFRLLLWYTFSFHRTQRSEICMLISPKLIPQVGKITSEMYDIHIR